MARPRKQADWENIRRDYEADQLTLRELETKYGVALTTIQRRAKLDGWEKDLSDKIRQATAAAVARAAVDNATAQLLAGLQSGEAKAIGATPPPPPKPPRPAPIERTVAPPAPPLTDDQVVQAAATLNKEVILRHRQDMTETRELALGMMDELHSAANARAELQALVDQAISLADAKIDAGKVRTAIGRLCGLHQRVVTLYRLGEVLARLQPLERKAYGIEDDKGGSGDYEEMLVRIQADIDAAESLQVAQQPVGFEP